MNEIVRISDVFPKLNKVDKEIYSASRKRPFSDYSGIMEMLPEAKDAFEFIAGDVGYQITDRVAWGENVTRLCAILRKYYADLTFDDLYQAFEMLVVGALDNLLPKDSYGNPDRKHYQQFNVEYMCKVLNTYRKERARVVGAVNEKLSKKDNAPSVEAINEYLRIKNGEIIRVFLRYKYTGILRFDSSVWEMLAYKELEKYGFVCKMEVSRDEQNSLIGSAFPKKENNSDFAKVRRMRLRKAFDDMINDEIQITDYIKIN